MVFLVMLLILVAIIAIIVFAATSNRQTYYQAGPTYVEPGVVIVDDTPLIAGMVAADIATDIAFSASQQQMMGDQGQYGDYQQGNDMAGGDFLGGDSGFDSSSGGFDGGGGDF